MTRAELNMPSNKKFGYFFSMVFAVTSFLLFQNGHFVFAWTLAVLSVVFSLIAAIIPDLLAALNKAWMGLGHLLSVATSPIIMAALFFCIFTPISIVQRLLGRDELSLNVKKRKTYWVMRGDDEGLGSFKNQY